MSGVLSTELPAWGEGSRSETRRVNCHHWQLPKRKRPQLLAPHAALVSPHLSTCPVQPPCLPGTPVTSGDSAALSPSASGPSYPAPPPSEPDPHLELGCSSDSEQVLPSGDPGEVAAGCLDTDRRSYCPRARHCRVEQPQTQRVPTLWGAHMRVSPCNTSHLRGVPGRSRPPGVGPLDLSLCPLSLLPPALGSRALSLSPVPTVSHHSRLDGVCFARRAGSQETSPRVPVRSKDPTARKLLLGGTFLNKPRTRPPRSVPVWSR